MWKTILICSIVAAVALVSVYAIIASIMVMVKQRKEKSQYKQKQQLEQLEKHNKELRTEVRELHKMVEDLKKNMQDLEKKKEDSSKIHNNAQNNVKNNNCGKSVPTEKKISTTKSDTSRTSKKPTISYEERARAEKEARRLKEKQEWERLVEETKNELLKQIEPFLKEHAMDSRSGERILEYYEKRHVSIRNGAVWSADKDRITSKLEWAAHSFFDDGGGVEGHETWEIAYINSKENVTIENEKLSNVERYDSNSKEQFYCEDPFGLSGVYVIRNASDEWHTD